MFRRIQNRVRITTGWLKRLGRPWRPSTADRVQAHLGSLRSADINNVTALLTGLHVRSSARKLKKKELVKAHRANYQLANMIVVGKLI